MLYLREIVAFGRRADGSEGQKKQQAYLRAKLKNDGLIDDAFTAETPAGRFEMHNLIARFPGSSNDIIVIASHYDTCYPLKDYVGANDGGSSTALLLELARALAARPREFTYWIAFFDGEEARGAWTSTDSLHGSRRMAADLARRNQLPRAVIVADMIGDRDLNIQREAASTPWLTDLVWDSARRLGQGTHFLPDARAVDDDHAPFLRAGVPAALLIDFDFPPWHTADDTLDKVSARSLQVVGDVLLDALPAIEERLGPSTGGRRP